MVIDGGSTLQKHLIFYTHKGGKIQCCIIPYIPNSNEVSVRKCWTSLERESVEEIYAFIPDEVRMKRPLIFQNLYIGNGSEKACGQYFNEGQHL